MYDLETYIWRIFNFNCWFRMTGFWIICRYNPCHTFLQINMLELSFYIPRKEKKILQAYPSDQGHQIHSLSDSHLEPQNCYISIERLSNKSKYVEQINKPRYNPLLLYQIPLYQIPLYYAEHLVNWKEFYVVVRTLQGPWMEML